jgi:hypothetical protein
MDLLDRLLNPFPTKAGAKDDMPLENAPPRAQEGRSINVFVQRAEDLVDIYSLPLGIETMKQHALLECG